MLAGGAAVEPVAGRAAAEAAVQRFPDVGRQRQAQLVDVFHFQRLDAAVRAQKVAVVDRTRFGERAELAVPLA